MSDEFRRLWEQQEAWRKLAEPLGDLRRHVDPIGDAYKQLSLGSATMDFIRQEEERRKLLSGIGDVGGFAKLAADAERQRKLLEGPIEEARRIGLLDPTSNLRQSITATMQARDVYDRLFRLPKVDELGLLAREAMATTALARSVFGTQDTLKAAMEDVVSPWLRIQSATASARAFADMVAIGRGIDVRRPFETEFAEALRPSLGDWRDLVTPPVEPLIDPLLRSGFYYERGFDPTLTDFTPPAFNESLWIAGLRQSEGTVADEAADDDDGFARARLAFDQLQRFEITLRRFIDRVMRKTFSDDWMRRQLPPGMLDAWVDKRDKAVKGGQPEQPLIDYADFADYRLIIERKDNWASVFKPVFGRADDVRESFQRLFPVRIATMHARIVTQDDELLLLVETKRVLKAIRATS